MIVLNVTLDDAQQAAMTTVINRRNVLRTAAGLPPLALVDLVTNQVRVLTGVSVVGQPQVIPPTPPTSPAS